jgi:hypothetical protein
LGRFFFWRWLGAIYDELWAFFEGVFGKDAVFAWCLCGEVVVDRVIIVGYWRSFFSAEKYATF